MGKELSIDEYVFIGTEKSMDFKPGNEGGKSFLEEPIFTPVSITETEQTALAGSIKSIGHADGVDLLCEAICALLGVISEIETIQREVAERQEDTIEQLQGQVRQFTLANYHLVDYLDLLKKRNHRVRELTQIKDDIHNKSLEKTEKNFAKIIYGQETRISECESELERYREENRDLYHSNVCLRRENRELKTDKKQLSMELLRTKYLVLQVYGSLQSQPVVMEVMPYLHAALFQSPVYELSLESNMHRLNEILGKKGVKAFVGPLNTDICEIAIKMQELIGNLHY